MTKNLLAATRVILGVAIAVTSFITRNATAITQGAKVLHGLALDLSLRIADRNVSKAWNGYMGDLKTIEILQGQSKVSYDNYCRNCDGYDNLYAGIVAEKQELGLA